MPTDSPHDIRAVLRRFDTLLDANGERSDVDPQSAAVAPLSGGLINDTFRLGDGHVLQRLHPIFGAAVNRDIDDLTRHLRHAGVPVPRICHARDGQPFVEITAQHSDDAAIQGVWRILTWLDGHTLHRLSDVAQARSAATMVGRFHRALDGVDHEFAFTRAGAHDTDAHMASITTTLMDNPGHRLADDVRRLRDELHQRWTEHEGPVDLPQRIGHGDLKVSNLRFDDGGVACGVLDLDTMAHLTVDIELGDALRSWCNRAAEDATEARLDTELFAGAVGGYVATMGEALDAAERDAIVPGLLRICLELSARFSADAINENYFGWSDAIAPTRGDHNLRRARGQLDLARKVSAHRAELERAVAAAARG